MIKKRKLKKWVEILLQSNILISILSLGGDIENLTIFAISKLIILVNMIISFLILKYFEEGE